MLTESRLYTPERELAYVPPSTLTGAPFTSAFAGSGDHLFQLLRRNADRPIQRNAGAPEQRGEQVALIAFDIGQEAARVQGAAAATGDDEGEVFPGVFVAV